MKDNIKITLYEPWMADQVINLFCRQYGNTTEQFSEFFAQFYNHTYQKDKSIRIVAIEGSTVAGFVSLCRWPYSISGKEYNTFQCGNVIISEDFRGKGLYNNMLNFIDENHQSFGIDLIIGFPIKEILKLYLKGGWKNPFNLSWYVKMINIFSIIVPVNKNRINKLYSSQPKFPVNKPTDKTELIKTNSFVEWHKAYNVTFNYFYFTVEDQNKYIEFSLKINIRKKIIKELIIGDIVTNSNDPEFIKLAFKKLHQAAFKTGYVSIISIAINDTNRDSQILKEIIQKNYKKIEKDIKFIYKNFTINEELVSKPESWLLYRRDLDTW